MKPPQKFCSRVALPLAVAKSTLAGSWVAPVLVTVNVNVVVPAFPSACDTSATDRVGAVSSFSIVSKSSGPGLSMPSTEPAWSSTSRSGSPCATKVMPALLAMRAGDLRRTVVVEDGVTEAISRPLDRAAAAPLVFLTAWRMLFTRGRLAPR